MTVTTTLYRFFDSDDRLLYVGIAGNPGRRWTRHAADKLWWGEVKRAEMAHFHSRQEALDAERDAIISERPIHNVVHARSGPPVVQPRVRHHRGSPRYEMTDANRRAIDEYRRIGSFGDRLGDI